MYKNEKITIFELKKNKNNIININNNNSVIR